MRDVWSTNPACYGISICFDKNSSVCKSCLFKDDCIKECLEEFSEINLLLGKKSSYTESRFRDLSKAEKQFEQAVDKCRNKKTRKIIMNFRRGIEHFHEGVGFDSIELYCLGSSSNGYSFLGRVSKFMRENQSFSLEQLKRHIADFSEISEKTSFDLARQAVEFFRSFELIEIRGEKIVVIKF